MATIFSSRARLGDQRVGEHAGVGGRVGLGLGLRAGDDVEGVDAVIFVVGRLGRRVALALLGDDMDEHRAVCGMSRTFFRTGSRWSRLWPSIGPT